MAAVLDGIERASERPPPACRAGQGQTILTEECQPGGEELTPRMKLRRRPIAEKYAAQTDAMYSP
jgi:long-chain acyl-CoA synthetase